MMGSGLWQASAQSTYAQTYSGYDTLRFVHSSFADFKNQVKLQRKPYILVFGAPWCRPCHRLRAEVFTDYMVAAFANDRYLAYYVDLESFDGLEVNNEFHVEQLPTVLFFDAQGNKKDEALGLFDAMYFYRKLRNNL